MFLLRLPHLNVLWRGSVHFCSSNITIKNKTKKNWEFSWNLTTEKQYIKKLKKEKKGKKKKEHKLWFYYIDKTTNKPRCSKSKSFFPHLIHPTTNAFNWFQNYTRIFLNIFQIFHFFFPFFFYIVSEFFIVSCLPYWDFMYKIVSKALYKMM